MKNISILNAVHSHSRALALESEADLKAGVRRLDVYLVTFKLETYTLFFPALCWHKMWKSIFGPNPRRIELKK